MNHKEVHIMYNRKQRVVSK